MLTVVTGDRALLGALQCGTTIPTDIRIEVKMPSTPLAAQRPTAGSRHKAAPRAKLALAITAAALVLGAILMRVPSPRRPGTAADQAKRLTQAPNSPPQPKPVAATGVPAEARGRPAHAGHVSRAEPDATAIVAPPGAPYIVPAGRSPIPQPGQTIIKPLAAGRLGEATLSFGTGRLHTASRRSPGLAPGPAPRIVPWREADQHLGQTITAEGRVLNARNIGDYCFLNFTRYWRGEFSIVILKKAFTDIPGKPEHHYLHKTIRVTGQVGAHRDRPQIRVYDAKQIRIVDSPR